jgi:hypothetical protein
MSVAFSICVPARNEASRIATLIAALGAQSVAPVPLALCVNNSDDGTADIARAAADRCRGRIALTVVERTFEPLHAHAGSARRVAMDLAAQTLPADGLLISTDADCRPPRDWVAENLAHAGVDRILGGRIELDEEEPVARDILALRKRFDRYWSEVRAIEDAIDPSPWDPAPRHGDHTGASLALSACLYRRAGGVPPLATGEDRALVEVAVAAGGKLAHPPSIWTRASARTSGRASGGMALDMQRWLAASAEGEAPRVPAYEHWRALAEWRRAGRKEDGDACARDAERRLPAMPCDMALPELSAS